MATVISSVPRGGLQLTQASSGAEALARAYQKGFSTEDAATWQALIRQRPVTGTEAFGEQAFAQSRYRRELMQPMELAHVAAIPLREPVFEGYGGALHVYRTESQGAFTPEQLNELSAAAAELDQVLAQSRQDRLGHPVVEAPSWSHHLPVRQIVLNRHCEAVFGAAALEAMDDRLREQVLQYGQRALADAGAAYAADRLALPDTRGDLWIFRVARYPEYAAVGQGPMLFVCLQPDCVAWSAVRAVDFQADPEIARLVPALRFMADEFHRGPTLGQISRMAHLSAFHFHRRFSELMGLTPKHFLLECQIYQAKQQLASRQTALSAIAKTCGFAHQSHFTSRFKQATGLTPTRWRRLVADRLAGGAAQGNNIDGEGRSIATMPDAQQQQERQQRPADEPRAQSA